MENEGGIFCDHEDDTMVIGAWNWQKGTKKSANMEIRL